MRKIVAILMAAGLSVAGGCSGDGDEGKGVDVKVETENKDKGGY
jgi:hypothetical protein